ncbi:MAG: WYL domain-containing protein [Sphaerochaetaceae bacterium]|nr:WYL domain-containing protein [Sphaerochaetaceae bacterium]
MNQSKLKNYNLLLKLLKKKSGTTIKEIQKTLKISRKSVYRLFKELEDNHIFLISEMITNSHSKKYHIDVLNEEALPILFWKEQELMQILLEYGKSMPPLNEPTLQLEEKLRKLELIPRENNNFIKITQLLPKGKRGPITSEIMFVIINSIKTNCIVNLSYNKNNSDQQSEYRIVCLKLFINNDGFYLNALKLNCENKGLRTFAIERISSLQPQETKFQVPKEIKEESNQQILDLFGVILGRDFIKAKLCFSKKVSDYVIEREWPAESASFEYTEDERVILTIKTRGKENLISWILHWKDEVVVLEPASLKQEIKKFASSILELY